MSKQSREQASERLSPEERCGPLRLERHLKDDGRALILYSRARDGGEPDGGGPAGGEPAGGKTGGKTASGKPHGEEPAGEAHADRKPA